MLKVEKICKSYKGDLILQDISFGIGKNQKIAFIGPNGAGKTTLLKILADKEKADSGTVKIDDNVVIGYLPQEIDTVGDETIDQYLKRVTGIDMLEEKMHRLEQDLEDAEKLEQYSEIQQQFLRLDGYNFIQKRDIILAGFGLVEISSDRLIASLSGGQKAKVALAGLLLQSPDLLLLDEPTNNLDLASIIWLETFLQNIKVSCMIISHDRHFLDKIVSKVFELDWFERNINEFNGTYSEYRDYKEKKRNRELEEEKQIKREKKRLKESVTRKKSWASKASKQTTSDKDKYLRGYRRDQSSKITKSAKAIESYVDKIKEVQVTPERGKLEIPIVAKASRAKHSISLRDVRYQYGNVFSLGPISLHIEYGSRIAILGPNGSGKSTLLQIISRKIIIEDGEIMIGKSLKFGNLMQENENIAKEKTIFEFFTEKEIDKQKIYFILDKFQFLAKDADKKINDLSPGEKMRILLALFTVQNVNVLILDEPTNHLDIEALEALEKSLIDYSGTIILVSHDRLFLENISPSHLFMMSNGSIKAISNQDDYQKSLEREAKKLIKQL